MRRTSVKAAWLTPKEALEGNSGGKYTIIFPTRANIERLGENDSAEKAIAASLRAKIKVVLPRLEKREDGTYVVIDEDAGYKTRWERIPG